MKRLRAESEGSGGTRSRVGRGLGDHEPHKKKIVRPKTEQDPGNENKTLGTRNEAE